MAKNDPPAEHAAKTEEVRPPAAAPVKRTPAEWAKELGFMTKRDPNKPQTVEAPGPGYAEAEALYRWSDHAAAYQAPADRFEITEESFRAAIASALQFPCVALHAPAFPPSQRERLENFRPRIAQEQI